MIVLENKNIKIKNKNIKIKSIVLVVVVAEPVDSPAVEFMDISGMESVLYDFPSYGKRILAYFLVIIGAGIALVHV